MSTSTTQKIFKFLSDYPIPIYLVGGSVRQLLLDKSVKDYDFAVSIGGIELASKLAKHLNVPFFVLDQERDIARVVLKDIDLDFACFGKNILSDLMARDLTINAIACQVKANLLDMPIKQWELIDPCGGKQDLEQGLIRGISLQNFENDPLRLLRAYRFAAVLNFEIDQQTKVWIWQSKDLIQDVAFERILQELFLILSTTKSAAIVREMQKLALLELLTGQKLSPESLSSLSYFENMYSSQIDGILNVYLETKICLERSVLFILKLALCLFSSTNSADLSSVVLNIAHWTLSSKEFKILQLWSQIIPQIIHMIQETQELDPIKLFHLFRQAKVDILGAICIIKIWLLTEQIQGSLPHLNALIDIWLDESNSIAHPKQLIDGNMLMKELNIKPGALVGKLLLSIQEAQACGKLVDDRDALNYAKATLIKLSTDHA